MRTSKNSMYKDVSNHSPLNATPLKYKVPSVNVGSPVHKQKNENSGSKISAYMNVKDDDLMDDLDQMVDDILGDKSSTKIINVRNALNIHR